MVHLDVRQTAFNIHGDPWQTFMGRYLLVAALDFRILLLTIPCMLTAHGVN